MQDDNTKSHLKLHFIVFIWGFTAILGALISLNALSLVWYRMMLAIFFIGVYLWYKKISVYITRKTLLLLCGAGVILACHWTTFFMAIKISNVSITLACLSTGAFFTSILEPIFFKRKLVWYEVFFGLIVICGLYIIFNVESQFVSGILLALFSAFLSALFSIINGKLVKYYSPSIISFYELIGGVLFLSLYLFLCNTFTVVFFVIPLSDWIWLFILSSICTAYALISSVKVMRFLSPYTVMLTVNLEPVYGLILAVLFFPETEKMDVNFYIGGLIILATVIMNAVLKKYYKKSEVLQKNCSKTNL